MVLNTTRTEITRNKIQSAIPPPVAMFAQLEILVMTVLFVSYDGSFSAFRFLINSSFVLTILLMLEEAEDLQMFDNYMEQVHTDNM